MLQSPRRALNHESPNRVIVASNKIVIASVNAGKIREIINIFAGANCEIIAQSNLGISSAPETGATFVDNALIKARHAAKKAGLPAIADDSGLVVDALDGGPGVHSARYAGAGASDEDNVDKLLLGLRQVPRDERGAHFECVAVWVCTDDNVAPVVATARWRGRILDERRGEGGFGYDPVFLDEGLMKSGAEMSLAEKNSRSHRGKAFRDLRESLFG